MFDNVTLALLLTAAGAGIAGGIVSTLVSVLRTAIPPLANVHGAGLAFAAALVLYIVAGFATITGPLDVAGLLNAWFVVFLAWLTCCAAAVVTHEKIVNPLEARVSPPQG